MTKKLEKSDNVYRLGGVDLNRGGQRKNGTLARPKKIKKFFFQLVKEILQKKKKEKKNSKTKSIHFLDLFKTGEAADNDADVK